MEDATSNHHPVLAQSSLETSNGAATTGGFIVLDVASLSSLAGDGPDTTATAASTPRTPRVVRSLSRKGSERKQPDGDAANGATTGGGGGERPLLSPLLVHVAAGDEMLNGFRLVNTPGGAGTPGGKSRHLARRPAPWLDPRRVVFLFATLSSVGTLILLYFTLSMTKMDSAGSGTGADSDAR